jgi:hypothetical protein
MKARLHLMPVLLLALCTLAGAAEAKPAVPPQPALAICVAADAAPAVRMAAERLAAACAAGSSPVLKAMAGGAHPLVLSDSAALAHGKVEERAYRHLVLIGMPDDPLIQAAWQHEARAEEGGFYIFGFGHLRGDIGYLESDRNPFLHGEQIASAPFDAELVSITGSTPAGVAAADAFLTLGLVNGVVAAGAWMRPATTLLDRDPLKPGAGLPAWVPQSAGTALRIAVSQGAEDEYRGVLADCQVEPQQIWRVKYYRTGVWSPGGAQHAIATYIAGLHRRAYGDTLWLAQFASSAEASAAEPLIARAAHLAQHGEWWSGAQPPYSSEKESPGPLQLWRHGEWLVMSTLDGGDAAAAHAAMR